MSLEEEATHEAQELRREVQTLVENITSLKALCQQQGKEIEMLYEENCGLRTELELLRESMERQ